MFRSENLGKNIQILKPEFDIHLDICMKAKSNFIYLRNITKCDFWKFKYLFQFLLKDQ